MTGTLPGIVAANIAYAVTGIGLAAALGAFDRRRGTYRNVLLGLPLGIAVAILLSSYAALAGLPLGPTALSLLAVAAAGSGALRLRRSRPGPAEPGAPGTLLSRAAGVVPALGLAVVLVAAARTMAVKPLAEWDGWVLWATKARVLYEHPGEGAAVLQERFYGAPSYPLGLPALEATTMRGAGHFDGTTVDLQLLALVAAAIAGLWVLLRPFAGPLTIGLALLATVASSQVAYQLTTNYADVPLAFLTAVGVVAAAAWLAAGDRQRPWQLACASVFLAAAAWTKNEGLLFSGVALASLLLVTLVARRGRRAALAASAGFVALVAPWRLYARANDLQTYDYDLSSFLDLPFLRERAGRIAPAARELLAEMTVTSSWGATVAVIVLAVVAALLTSRRLPGAYAALWLALSFGGLVAIYWISNHTLENDLENSSHRVVVTLLVTGLCLSPLLLGEAVEAAESAVRRTLLSRLPGRRTPRTGS